MAAEKLYVLGHPVAHSKSPVMYNALYSQLGLPWEYGLMDCATTEEAEAFLAARDFLSINITMPYKPLAFEVATAQAASAKLAKGANVLVKRGDALIAYNTDGDGCIANLERCGVDFRNARVAVCGTGPTSMAIVHAAAVAGAYDVLLLGRDRERTRERLREYVRLFDKLANATIELPAAKEHHRTFRQAYQKTAFKFGTYETSTQAIAGSDIIIDATPLGMKAGDPAPFDTSLLHEGQTVFDVVYGHGETALAAGARAAGCKFVDGQGMLVAQAVATAQIVCDLSGVSLDLSFDEMFAIMARAAEFDCA